MDPDYGAAICNTGICTCINCSFIKNYCCNGGAIFNQGFLNITSCTFKENDAYNKGDNICNTGDGKVIVDGKEIKGSEGVVQYAKGLSAGQIRLLCVLCPVLTTVGTFIIGCFLLNPLVGLAVGAVIGCLVGVIASLIACDNIYDVHFSKLKLTTYLISSCIVAGALGGALGGYVSSLTAPALVENVVIEEGGYVVSEGSSGLASSSSSIAEDSISVISSFTAD